MSDKRLLITASGIERRDGYTAYVEFGGCIQAFVEDTPDRAMAKARQWARDLRDALNAADLHIEPGTARGQERHDAQRIRPAKCVEDRQTHRPLSPGSAVLRPERK